MKPAGYSGTPLPAKLGLKPGQRIAFASASPGFQEAIGPLPEGATAVEGLRAVFDLAVAFVRSRAELHATLARARMRLDPDGALWIGWPKKASGMETDLTENAVREAALEAGLVDVKVCAIDATWSGLKLVVPAKDRPRLRRRATASRAGRR